MSDDDRTFHVPTLEETMDRYAPVFVRLAAIERLAANLAQAALACAAFAQGEHSERERVLRHGQRRPARWTPGCQRPAPGWER